jgi:beta-hydroxylase
MSTRFWLARLRLSPTELLHLAKKAAKRLCLVALVVYFIPVLFTIYLGVGLLDFVRNRRRTLGALDCYFAGNGFFTLLLAPFNLLMDVITLPYWNKGIYQLSDLPEQYQNEINAIIEAAGQGDLVAKLQSMPGEFTRRMIFFKWYGKNVQTSIDMPEYHCKYKYIRTIGVSIFNTRQSTTKHFGPLRVTLRVLYNINDIHSDYAFICVGNHTNYWRRNKLFIFDDTLQHQSVNQSEEIRYCMFLDILRPSLFPGLLSAILAGVRLVIARFNFVFYRHWVFVK